ncbi:MAG: T9SS type A sorting domain-containing protein [candidate division KSB1 bacterium]|nr:T9SS type A sorting domain-containing protein [candidate division KSB1 bacterium]
MKPIFMICCAVYIVIQAHSLCAQGWSEPVKLGPPINDGRHTRSHPFLTRDDSMLYFTSYVGGTTDIFYCKRNGDKWGAVQSLPDYINTSASEHSPSLTADNRTLYFVRWTTYNSWDIFYSECKEGQWGRPQNIGPPINTPGMEFGCCISSGGDTLVFEGPHYWETVYPPDLMYSVKTDTGWSFPTLFFDYYDGNRSWESYPFISSDGKTIWFRADYHVDWGRDIIYSSWDGEKWSAPEPVGPPVNTEQAEMAPCLSSDGRELYFARIYDHGDSIRSEEIYRSIRLTNRVQYQPTQTQKIDRCRVYPNPFNSRVILQTMSGRFSNIIIYNITGKEVKRFTQPGGNENNTLVWNGTNNQGNPVPAGVYLCRITLSGGEMEWVKTILIK